MQGYRGRLHRLASASSLAVAPLAALMAAQWASANVWIGTGGASNWNDPTKWQEAAFPDGVGSVANFSVSDLTANVTLTVTDAAGDNTIVTGSLLVGDVSGGNAWTINLGVGQTWIFNDSDGWAQLARPNVAGTANTNVNASFLLGSNLEIRNDAPSNLQVFVNGVIGETGGSFGLEVNSSANRIMHLAGANTFTGGMTLSGGSLRIGASSVMDGTTIVSGSLGRGTVTFRGGALVSNAANPAGARTIANDFILDGDVIIGGTTGGINGSLTFTGNGTLNRDVQITPGGSNSGFVEIKGVIGEAGGSRNLTIASAGGSSSFTLSGANLYTGKTVLGNNSRLALGNRYALQYSTVENNAGTNSPKFVGAAGPTFTWGGLSGGAYSVTIESVPLTSYAVIALSDDTPVTPGAITLEVGNNNTNQAFTGRLTGAGNFVKIGSGTQVLNPTFTTALTPVLQANDYAGTTTVAGGKLVVNAWHSSTAGFQVNSGATLGGGGTIASALTVDGTLSPGASTGLLTLQSDLTMGSASQMEIEIGGTSRGAPAAGYDATNVTGAVTLDGTITVVLVGGFDPDVGASFDLLNWGSINAAAFNAATDFILPALVEGKGWDTSQFVSDGSISVLAVPVPEPASAAVGLLGLGLMRRRRSPHRMRPT